MQLICFGFCNLGCRADFVGVGSCVFIYSYMLYAKSTFNMQHANVHLHIQPQWPFMVFVPVQVNTGR